MISRAVKFAGKQKTLDKEKQTQLLAKFSDAKSIGSWAAPSVAQSVDSGLIDGLSDKEFAPKTNATRAQATVMLKRLLASIEFMN
ncbi:S-layer homology domain-containing protein [Paenibacillus cremeus]|uniref:S-layer homology domain-containing protein n=1 Tax=Paenibacillus cremeus TaxID=2163881 RepID=A0A559K5M7_9BACL|nr:S-layer homology domain-containing protein [Paenibacillus cremeus]TVY07455.1 S-layer homology domain-containing protein [Paenibacillus cremeus]